MQNKLVKLKKAAILAAILGIVFGSGGFFVVPKEAQAATNTARIENPEKSVKYFGSGWEVINGGGYSGGNLKRSKTAGDYVTYSFKGTFVKWVSTINPYQGKSDVYLDGVLKKDDLDLYSGSTQNQVIVYTASGLSNALHTIKVVATGTRNASALNYWTSIDAFDVYHAETVSMSANTTSIQAGQAVTFTASTADNLNDTITYSWKFGDGATLVQTANPGSVSATHTYGSGGSFTAVLTATCSRGLGETKSVVINVASPPQPPQPPGGGGGSGGTSGGGKKTTTNNTPEQASIASDSELPPVLTGEAKILLSEVEIDGKTYTPEEFEASKVEVGKKIIFRGTAAPSTALLVNILKEESGERIYIFNIVSDDVGNWEYALDQPLEFGKYSIEISQTGSFQEAPESIFVTFEIVAKGEGKIAKKSGGIGAFIVAGLIFLGKLILVLLVLAGVAFGGIIGWRRLEGKLAGFASRNEIIEITVSKEKANADGKDEILVSATYSHLDKKGNKTPVPGTALTLSASGAGAHLVPKGTVTDTKGEVQAVLSSRVEGEKLISATIEEGDVSGHKVVEFLKPENHKQDLDTEYDS